MIEVLTSLSAWQVFLLAVGGTIALTVAAAAVIHRTLHGQPRERAGITAAAYMTALGSLFAILTGFLISSEFLTLRSAQNAVGSEVAAASQLAQASGALTPADTGALQESLVGYLDSIPAGEWPALATGAADRSPSADRLRELQRTVFVQANRSYVPDGASGTMQQAVNDMTASRRERVVIAAGSLPLPLFLLAALSGLALLVNALLVSNRQGWRYGWVAAGIVLAVALDLGAILAISAPFQGAFAVDTAPITQLAGEIRDGAYLPWVATP